MKIYEEVSIDMNPESSSYGEHLSEDSYEYGGELILLQDDDYKVPTGQLTYEQLEELWGQGDNAVKEYLSQEYGLGGSYLQFIDRIDPTSLDLYKKEYDVSSQNIQTDYEQQNKLITQDYGTNIDTILKNLGRTSTEYLGRSPATPGDIVKGEYGADIATSGGATTKEANIGSAFRELFNVGTTQQIGKKDFSMDISAEDKVQADLNALTRFEGATTLEQAKQAEFFYDSISDVITSRAQSKASGGGGGGKK